MSPGIHAPSALAQDHAPTNKGLSTEAADWPTVLGGDMAWTGTDVKDSHEYIYQLSRENIEEVEKALFNFKGMKLPP
jgi:hypothetical protein